MFRGRARRLHFVGIGGVGMCGIAEVLLTLGYDVRGSDRAESPATAQLASRGATIFVGHKRSHVKDADVVVISTAIASDNPEILAAREAGIPVVRRAEMLAELMRLKYGIAVAGTHGKTTTTSLIAALLEAGQMDPTIVIGGRLKAIGANARLGAGEYLVAEADESDGSFLRLMPTIAVITNIGRDHLDHWTGGLSQITQGFADFVQKVPFYGAAILCVDHANLQSMLPSLDKRVVTYGFNPQADYVASQVEAGPLSTRFTLTRRGELLGPMEVGLVGRHNVQNALASLAVADEVGVSFADSRRALAQFSGIGRRFEHKGTIRDILVVDDYGHHPTEIRATLEAARAAYPDRRLVVLFEPHRYSRTRDLLDDFASAFNACHTLRLLDIYPAGEAPLENIDSQRLAEVVRAHGHRDTLCVGTVDNALGPILALVRPGDLVLTLGAGAIFRLGEALIARLSAP